MKAKLGCGVLMQICILCFTSICVGGEEIWTEVRSPNFVVVSNASVKQARRTAKLFEQFRLLIQTVMVGSKIDPATPLTIFAAKDERSFKTLLAEEHQEKGAAQKAGLFLQGPERQLVAVRIDLPEDQTYHAIYHEYVHLITQLNYGTLPLWLTEGLAEFFAYSELSDNLTYLGKVKNEVIVDLRTKPLIPLSTLLSVTHDSPYYHQHDKTSIFYRQSWALTHYLIIGDKRAHSKQLMSFIEMIQNGVPEMDATTRAFGDLKALETALANYLQLPTTAYFEVPAKLSIKEDQYEARTLSPAESLALRGELLVFCNQTDRAKTTLAQALSMDSQNARANEAMGQLFVKLNNREQARKYFTAAADLDSQSCMANFYAAQAIASQNGDLDISEKYLRKAIAINPEFAPACAQLSQLLQRKSNLAEALEYAKKAEALQPRVLAYKINIASLLAAMGQIDEAYEYGRHISVNARDENDRRQAESFMTWLTNVRDQKLQIQRMQGETNQRVEVEAAERENVIADEQPMNASGEAETKRKAEVARLRSIKPGPAVKIEGIVKSVKCDSPAIMDIVLETTGKPKLLHAEDYSKVAFGLIGAAAPKGFQPCSDLEGKFVEIEYSIVLSESFSGFIKSIILGKK